MPRKVQHEVHEDEIDPRKHYIEQKKDEYMQQLHAPQNEGEPEKVVKQPKLEQFPEIDEEEYKKKIEAEIKQKEEQERLYREEEEKKEQARKQKEEEDRIRKEEEDRKH